MFDKKQKTYERNNDLNQAFDSQTQEKSWLQLSKDGNRCNLLVSFQKFPSCRFLLQNSTNLRQQLQRLTTSHLIGHSFINIVNVWLRTSQSQFFAETQNTMEIALVNSRKNWPNRIKLAKYLLGSLKQMILRSQFA